MTFAGILFASAFLISSVAAYYSVAGLVAIFSSAAYASIIMGGALEAAKLVAASWLYRNWKEAPKFLKYYFTSAVVILSIITSMGIFGYLSKAHLDQSVVIGDSATKLAVYDEKIKTAKENIDANRKALKQLDEAVDQTMGRSDSETGADKAIAIRRSQAKERTRLQAEISTEQKTIAEFNEIRAPLSAEVRKIEAEVGPIKYVAELIYGESSEEMIGKAVRLMIILIICVFDPLAILLLIAANMELKKRKPVEEVIPDKVVVNEVIEQKEEVDAMEKPSAVTPRKPKKPIAPKKPKPSVPKKKPIKPKVPKKKPSKPTTPKKPTRTKPKKRISIGSGEDVSQDDHITIKKSTVYRFDG
jgi:hypothetical protein